MNDDFFSQKHETELQFYWAGFIASSASIIPSGQKTYRIEFGLSSIYKEHLEWLVIDLESNAPIRNTIGVVGAKKHSRCRLVLSSTQMVNDLIRFGIAERKKQFIKCLGGYLHII